MRSLPVLALFLLPAVVLAGEPVASPADTPVQAAVDASAAAPATVPDAGNIPGTPVATPEATNYPYNPADDELRARVLRSESGLPMIDRSLPPRPDDGKRGGLIIKKPPAADVVASADDGPLLDVSAGLDWRRLDIASRDINAARGTRTLAGADPQATAWPGIRVNATLHQPVRDRLDAFVRLDVFEALGGDVESLESFTDGTLATTRYGIDRENAVAVGAGVRWQQPLRKCWTLEAGGELRQMHFVSKYSFSDVFGNPVAYKASDSRTGVGLDAALLCRIDRSLSVVGWTGATLHQGYDSLDAGLGFRWHFF